MDSEYDDTIESEPAWSRRRSSAAADDSPQDQWPGRGELDGKDRHRYQVLRSHFKQQCQARGDLCYFCQGAIDYRLKHGHPMAFEVHHTEPVSASGGDPARYLDTRLWAASHALHNRVGWAGDAGGEVAVVPGTENDGMGIPSEDWDDPDSLPDASNGGIGSGLRR